MAGRVSIPRLLIAGTHSGVGKTTVTVGLLRAFTRSGLRLQPFKAGPDYIDPGWHSAAAGRPCRNLDTWLIPPARIPRLFERACAGADLGLIEGVMGLYDGRGAVSEEGSTAELAKLLSCPVLLVLDAGAVSRSAAAMVRGFKEMDRKVRIAGCIVNRLSGPGHFRLVKEGIERLAGVPVLGWLPKQADLHLPERHLGLVPAAEKRNPGWMGRLERLVRQGFDLPAIRRIAEKAPALLLRGASAAKQSPRALRVPIAVARDEAFHFYYRENLELLEEEGAEILPFSPLKDRRLPRGAAALVLGGGFPELFAPELARNRSMKEEIRRAVLAGMPAYAECGGLMYLARSITAGGRDHPMVGLMPGRVRMTDRLQNFGYQEVEALRDSVVARAGERARGHEFHHSVLTGAPSARHAAYRARAGRGGESRVEGYVKGSLLASYVHLHFWSNPRWAGRFVTAARRFNRRQSDVEPVSQSPVAALGAVASRARREKEGVVE